jgi:hypothetical protein
MLTEPPTKHYRRPPASPADEKSLMESDAGIAMSPPRRCGCVVYAKTSRGEATRVTIALAYRSDAVTAQVWPWTRPSS